MVILTKKMNSAPLKTLRYIFTTFAVLELKILAKITHPGSKTAPSIGKFEIRITS